MACPAEKGHSLRNILNVGRSEPDPGDLTIFRVFAACWRQAEKWSTVPAGLSPLLPLSCRFAHARTWSRWWNAELGRVQPSKPRTNSSSVMAISICLSQSKSPRGVTPWGFVKREYSRGPPGGQSRGGSRVKTPIPL